MVTLRTCPACKRHHAPGEACPFCARGNGSRAPGLGFGGALLIATATTLGCVGTAPEGLSLIDTVPTPHPSATPTPSPTPATTYGLPPRRARRKEAEPSGEAP